MGLNGHTKPASRARGHTPVEYSHLSRIAHAEDEAIRQQTTRVQPTQANKQQELQEKLQVVLPNTVVDPAGATSTRDGQQTCVTTKSFNTGFHLTNQKQHPSNVRAVVIHFHDAAIAGAAMMGSRWLDSLASAAVSTLGNVSAGAPNADLFQRDLAKAPRQKETSAVGY